jgi:hypothetical protein
MPTNPQDDKNDSLCGAGSGIHVRTDKEQRRVDAFQIEAIFP